MVSSRKKPEISNPDKIKKPGKRESVSVEEKQRLFDLYIKPRMLSVKTLSVKYTDKYQDVEDNYNYVLAQMYNYIYTYDPSKSIDTWIHIVTKRACFNQNKKRAKYNQQQTDIEMCSSDALHQHGTANIVDAMFGTLADNVSDVVYNALLQINPCKLSAFLRYAQGLKIREIVKLEYQDGHLEKKSDDLVKSRIYWARQELKYILAKHGISRTNH